MAILQSGRVRHYVSRFGKVGYPATPAHTSSGDITAAEITQPSLFSPVSPPPQSSLSQHLKHLFLSRNKPPSNFHYPIRQLLPHHPFAYRHERSRPEVSTLSVRAFFVRRDYRRGEKQTTVTRLQGVIFGNKIWVLQVPSRPEQQNIISQARRPVVRAGYARKAPCLITPDVPEHL